MANSETDTEIKRETRKLDGHLPEGIDRRKFLTGTITTLVGGAFAGCASDSGQSDGESGGDGGSGTPMAGGSGDSDTIVKNVVWRMNWSAQTNYTPSFISPFRGVYADQGISAPQIQPGFGAPDTARRVGTGEAQVGISNVPPEVNGLDQGFNFGMIGATTQNEAWGMHYRTDRVDGVQDIGGKTVLLASPNAEFMWDVMLNVVDAPLGEAETQFSAQSGAPALLAQGEVDAVVNTLNRVPVYKRQVQERNSNADVQSTMIASHADTVGFNLIANTNWIADEDQSVEYLSRLLAGWSEATKWTYLHPEEALDIMRNDVNPELQSAPRDLQLDVMRSGITALNLTEDVRDQGPGYLDQEKLDGWLSNVAQVLEVDAPSAEDTGIWEVQENAELASFSSDEWSNVQEFSQPYGEFI